MNIRSLRSHLRRIGLGHRPRARPPPTASTLSRSLQRSRQDRTFLLALTESRPVRRLPQQIVDRGSGTACGNSATVPNSLPTCSPTGRYSIATCPWKPGLSDGPVDIGVVQRRHDPGTRAVRHAEDGGAASRRTRWSLVSYPHRRQDSSVVTRKKRKNLSAKVRQPTLGKGFPCGGDAICRP